MPYGPLRLSTIPYDEGGYFFKITFIIASEPGRILG